MKTTRDFIESIRRYADLLARMEEYARLFAKHYQQSTGQVNCS